MKHVKDIQRQKRVQCPRCPRLNKDFGYCQTGISVWTWSNQLQCCKIHHLGQRAFEIWRLQLQRQNARNHKYRLLTVMYLSSMVSRWNRTVNALNNTRIYLPGNVHSAKLLLSERVPLVNPVWFHHTYVHEMRVTRYYCECRQGCRLKSCCRLKNKNDRR